MKFFPTKSNNHMVTTMKRRLFPSIRFCSALGVCSLFAVGCNSSSQEEVVKTSYYHAYGPKVTEGAWQAQGSSGEVVEMLKNGVEVRREYRGGIPHGVTTWTFPYSKVIERTEEFDNGRRFLTSKNYDNGSPKSQEQWLTPEHRIVHSWYIDGAPRIIEEYLSDRLTEGQYFTGIGEVEGSVSAGNGTKIDRSSDGKLMAREQIASGDVISRETFYPSGQVREVISLIRGKRDGQSRRYAEGGEPLVIEHWKKGLLDGLQLVFEGGQPVRQIPYVRGLKSGVEIHLRPGTEDIVEEISWYNDQRHGVSKTYLADQTIAEWFWKGGRVSEEQFSIRNRATLVSMRSEH